MNEAKPFKTTITAEHRLLDLHLKETFQYRDLIFLFVKRDFTAFYKQTILGPLWAIWKKESVEAIYFLYQEMNSFNAFLLPYCSR